MQLLFALLLLLLADSAGAQSRQPPQQNIATERRSDDRYGDQQDTDYADANSAPAPSSANAAAENKRGETQQSTNNPENDVAPNFWNIASAIAMVILTIGLLVAAGFQASISRTIGRNQLTLSFPPRLRVTRPILWARPLFGPENRKKPPTFRPGQIVDGRMWAINYGREDAIVTAWDCIPFWCVGDLPMNPPYPLPVDQRAPFFMFHTRVPVERLKPGEVAHFEYSFRVPFNFRGADDPRRLYVLGRIYYRDRLDTHRAVFFARRYSLKRKSFRRVKHPEYESEE